MMKNLLSFFFFICLCTLAGAQQYPLFTNYVINDYGFNPAIGIDTNGVHANLVYRKQWDGINLAPETMIAGMRGRMKKAPIGLGAYFYKDQAGVLDRSGGTLMLSFSKNLSEETILSIGVAAGFYNLTLSDQTKVDDLSDQIFLNGSMGESFPDFNAGIYLQSNGFFMGISSPQILEREINFSEADDKSKLNRHYYGMVGYKIPVNDKMKIEPSALFKFTQDSPFQIDASLRLLFKGIWLGGTYRTDDAIAAMVGFNLGHLNLAYAYDLTQSNLKNYSNGSHEISIGIRFGKVKDQIPNEEDQDEDEEEEKDQDGDGIVDKKDECPEVAGPKENGGCPEEDPATMDSDGDGIVDLEDKCPKVAGVKLFEGCPAPDRDNDGMRDDIDKCPTVPGVPSNQGCPVDDRDNDGVVDAYDKCPNEAGSIQNLGCPGTDSDGDGVMDDLDECPNTFGEKGNGGCPVVNPTQMESLNLAIQNLYFDSNRSHIWRESYPHLNKLAEVLVQNPDWQLRISGHADSEGDTKSNMQLSKDRTNAVMFYFINRGVKRRQLISESFGDTMPFTSNKNEAGRQLNRRVELKFEFN